MIEYQSILDKNMLNVFKDILINIRDKGLSNNNHLYVTFSTNYQNVELPNWLRQKYPEEMTIVIQYEYYYDVDLKLSYINIFLNENNIRDRVYSIELNSLRVDVWTMTGGGFTTREMFPIGLCKFVEINNFLSYIESLK